MSDIETAVELFRSGCACSQALIGTYGPKYGLEKGLALRLSAGFAGGMRRAETCGAVTGAYMALGLAYSGDACGTAEGRKATYAAVGSLSEQFIRRHGSLLCRELLCCDISTPEGAKYAQANSLFQTKCPELVRSAAEILEGLVPPAEA